MASPVFASADEVWEQLRSLSNAAQHRKAAVSYVTSDAILKFSSNDVLVLDASEYAIQQGHTSARVIQRAKGRGAAVYSVNNLHSKVLLFDHTLVVGSANISVRSSRSLIEAVLLSENRSTVNQASSWIDELASSGQLITDDVLQRLIDIENQRPPIKRTFRDLAETHIVFFKQVMAGDIEKYLTRSSTSGTGGGARNLRISRAPQFRPLLSQMLAERGGDRRFTHGRVVSRVGRTSFTTDVQLWRPTTARSNELRISRFYEVPGWEISEDRFRDATNSHEMLFYVLEMDIHGTVSAKVLTLRQLTRRDATIRGHLETLRQHNAGRSALIGAVDVVRNIVVP